MPARPPFTAAGTATPPPSELAAESGQSTLVVDCSEPLCAILSFAPGTSDSSDPLVARITFVNITDSVVLQSHATCQGIAADQIDSANAQALPALTPSENGAFAFNASEPAYRYLPTQNTVDYGFCGAEGLNVPPESCWVLSVQPNAGQFESQAALASCNAEQEQRISALMESGASARYAECGFLAMLILFAVVAAWVL